MKKYVQIMAVLVVFTLLVIAKQDLSSAGAGDDGRARLVVAPSGLPVATPITTAVASPVSTVPSPTTSTFATPTPTPTPAPTPQGKYKNGTYTGSVADAYYGNIQVQAIISNGKIANVTFLQYPNDNRTSLSINSQAMPYPTQQALQAQRAQVNTDSGASDSSAAFRQSLQVALNQAV